MAVEIPDLWPAYVADQIVTPLAILRIQAEKLRVRSNGILEAEVQSSVVRNNHPSPPSQVKHRFLINAPAIAYQHELLTCSHEIAVVYPVKIESIHLFLNESTDPDWTSANNQAELLYQIGNLLNSPSARSAIESMIARSNEASLAPS